jgi:hypothetical protein
MSRGFLELPKDQGIMPPIAHVRSAALVILAGAQLLLQACTDQFVVGSIPPAAFQFINVVPHDGVGTGGWKVAQVVILLGKLSPWYPETTLCEVEVGVPEANRKGPVPDSVAQVEAAGAADEAARHVLKKKRLPTAVACEEFRRKMQSVLTEPTMDLIPGAQVTGFQRTGIPRTTFP